MSRRSSKEEIGVARDTVRSIFEGSALEEARVISTEQMDSLYAYAHEFYEQGRLDEAEKFFHFLCIYDFYNCHYWMGLAAVQQLKQNYQRAIELYAVAFVQGKSDCRPMLYSGQCQLALGAVDKARRCFEYVLEHVKDDDLRKQAQGYIDALSPIESQGEED